MEQHDKSLFRICEPAPKRFIASSPQSSDTRRGRVPYNPALHNENRIAGFGLTHTPLTVIVKRRDRCKPAELPGFGGYYA